MKKTYKTPKAKLVNFCYDEQITAESGNTSSHGDPNHIGRCQQSDPATCAHFWSMSIAGQCKEESHSIPGFPVGM